MKKFTLIIFTFALFSCSDKHRFELLDSGHTGVKFVNRVIDTDSIHVMNFEYIYNGAGVGIADLNHDGWMDVYVTCTAYDEPEKRRNRFYINQGLQEDSQLVFKDMAESYGIADDSYSVQAAFFDYDRDGDLDLYILNNYDNNRLSASYRPKINDGSAPSNDDLYRNNGDGTFTHVSQESGIVCEGFGLGLVLGDVNKDGYPDIYVSNDYVSNDLLYINQGDGAFQNRIDRYLSYQTRSSMGNDHTYDISTGYYDANQGIVLMSKNNRPLSELKTPAQTGLLLHGMVESLLYMEGNTPFIVAGFNRDSVQVFSTTKKSQGMKR